MKTDIAIDPQQMHQISMTLGATNCRYFEYDHPELGKLFIKSGEKVGQEIENYRAIAREIEAAYILTPHGTLDAETIVLPYADDAGRGFRMVDTLWQYPQTTEQFIEFQANAFEALCSLYLGSKQQRSYPAESLMFGRKVDERLEALRELGDRNVLTPTGQERTLETLLRHRVPLGQSSELPGLEEMVQHLREHLDARYQYLSCTIHADPQPSNFVEHEGRLRIADLSDIRRQEDLAWDIAKWMNYVARFHQIVKMRGEKAEDLPDHQVAKPSRETCDQIRLALITQVSETMDIGSEELDLRSRLGEFVVNVNTLRRHVLKFPLVSPRVIQAIGDSYLDAITYLEEL